MDKILFYLNYFTYIILTLDDRYLYRMGLNKGYNCIGVSESYTMYGVDTQYIYDKESKPKRMYKTFEEYKKVYYHKKRVREYERW